MAIRNLISTTTITNQGELLRRLRKEGFEMTQATLSRDLKFLRVGKVMDNRSGYVYVLPDLAGIGTNSPRPENFPLNGFVSIDFARNMAVMKVLPGYAPGIASAIDHLDSWEILGTIAGDDTILIILREGVSHGDLTEALAGIIPGIKVGQK